MTDETTTLSDGTLWTIEQIRAHTGLSYKGVKARLRKSLNPDSVLAPRQSKQGAGRRRAREGLGLRLPGSKPQKYKRW